MDFRKRLAVTFMIMTLLPILLLVSFGFIIINYQTNVMQQAYETEVNTLQALQNPEMSFFPLRESPMIPWKKSSVFAVMPRIL